MKRRTFLGALPLLSMAKERRMTAGTAKVNITPRLGLSIAGGMRDHLGEDVHDELHARCLLLDDGAARIAFVVCDSCAIADEVIADAKRQIESHTGIPPSHVLVSATHSHSAPAAAFLFQSRPDADYQRFVAVRIADSVRLALKRKQAARIGWGVGKEPSLLFNRRFFLKPGTMPADPFGRTVDKVKMNPGVGNPNVLEPAGPIDPDVSLLAVQTADGKPLAALCSYALHYVGGVPGRVYSADYFGVWAQEMERRLSGGPEFVGLLANACSGNINNVDVKTPAKPAPPFSRMREVAAILAAESERVWRKAAFQDHAPLGAALRMVTLGVRRPNAEEVQAAKAKLVGAAEQVSEIDQVYAKETVQLAAYPDRVQAPVQAIRIGSLGIATFPGEAFVELGLEVKRKSPFQPTFLIELANGYHGYIPDVEGHRQGGYETWRAKSSYLEVDAAPKLVAAALEGLRSLAPR